MPNGSQHPTNHRPRSKLKVTKLVRAIVITPDLPAGCSIYVLNEPDLLPFPSLEHCWNWAKRYTETQEKRRRGDLDLTIRYVAHQSLHENFKSIYVHHCASIDLFEVRTSGLAQGEKGTRWLDILKSTRN